MQGRTPLETSIEPAKDLPVEAEGKFAVIRRFRKTVLKSRPGSYDVVVIGGGTAGLAAATFCSRKFLSTAVLEGECWGGILMRHCPDKPIDNYPGAPRGILARDLAGALVGDAREAGAYLIDGAVESITPEGSVRGRGVDVTGKMIILACGSTAAEANTRREREFAGGGGVHYKIPDPSRFRGKRVIVVGGGDTAVFHVQQLAGVADRIVLVHRQPGFRSQCCSPEELTEAENVDVLLGATVEEILGSDQVEGVRIRNLAGDRATFDLPADAVVIAAGRVPNTVLFRDLGLQMDPRGQVVTDAWQKTSLPRFLAIGDVSSPLKMIITAVAQAAAASHEAFLHVRAPFGTTQ